MANTTVLPHPKQMFGYMVEGGEGSLERKLREGTKSSSRSNETSIPVQVLVGGLYSSSYLTSPSFIKKKSANLGGVRPVFALLIRLVQCFSPPPLDQCVSTSGALLPAHPSILARGLHGKERDATSSAV